MNAPPFQEVDHVNGNKLDNRKSNLRFATRAQNAMNRVERLREKLRGVFVRNGIITAMIKKNGRIIYLGTYNDPFMAARLYDAAARELFGEFALLNFPLPGEQKA